MKPCWMLSSLSTSSIIAQRINDTYPVKVLNKSIRADLNTKTNVAVKLQKTRGSRGLRSAREGTAQ